MTVLAQEGRTLSLRVEEVLHGALPLAPGDVIEGEGHGGRFACYAGDAPLDLGDQAFAFYEPHPRPLPACVERETCIAACDAQNEADHVAAWQASCPDASTPATASASESRRCGPPINTPVRACKQECEAETAAVCLPRPEPNYLRGNVRLSPWADPIVFARTDRGELSVPLAQLDDLLEFSGDEPEAPAYTPACRERFGDWAELTGYH